MKQVATVDVGAPDEVIWSVLADVESWPRWTPTMRRVRLLDGRALAPGARVRIRQPRLPVLTWVVDELVPGRAFSWVTGFPGGRTRATHELVAGRDGRTRVVLGLEQTGLAAVAGRAMRGLVRRYLDLEAASLRRRCE